MKHIVRSEPSGFVSCLLRVAHAQHRPGRICRWGSDSVCAVMSLIQPCKVKRCGCKWMTSISENTRVSSLNMTPSLGPVFIYVLPTKAVICRGSDRNIAHITKKCQLDQGGAFDYYTACPRASFVQSMSWTQPRRFFHFLSSEIDMFPSLHSQA